MNNLDIDNILTIIYMCNIGYLSIDILILIMCWDCSPSMLLAQPIPVNLLP